MRSISLIILMTVCLAFLVVGPFAGSALAQDDETPVGPDTILQNRLLHDLAADAASRPSASPAGQTQQQANSSAVTPNATFTCSFTFTSGSGQTYLQFCVTVNGNIVEFQSPVGVEQIRQGGIDEGYGICDASTGSGVAYFDYAQGGDSGNWNPPVTISSSLTSVKIGRTTTDGHWTLTQTITMVAGTNPSAKITMALKNNSSSAKSVYLMRYADSDPDNANSTGNYTQNLDGTVDSAWGYLGYSAATGSGHYGLMLQIVGNPAPATVPYGRVGFAQNTPSGPAPCSAGTHLQSPILNTDGSIVYYYVFTLKAAQTVTVNERYISF